jgi:glycine cleavage system H lipoate-binding protein
VGCFKGKGETIVDMTYNEGEIVVRMPVDGEILEINEVMLCESQGKIMQHLDKSGWIIKISPSNPGDRAHLIPIEEYRLLK